MSNLCFWYMGADKLSNQLATFIYPPPQLILWRLLLQPQENNSVNFDWFSFMWSTFNTRGETKGQLVLVVYLLSYFFEMGSVTSLCFYYFSYFQQKNIRCTEIRTRIHSGVFSNNSGTILIRCVGLQLCRYYRTTNKRKILNTILNNIL